MILFATMENHSFLLHISFNYVLNGFKPVEARIIEVFNDITTLLIYSSNGKMENTTKSNKNVTLIMEINRKVVQILNLKCANFTVFSMPLLKKRRH